MIQAALLDGDIIAYRASSVLAEGPWGREGEREPLSLGEAVATTKKMAADWARKAGGEPIVCLSGSWNFRKTLNPSYKAHRKPHPRPDVLAACKAALVDTFPTRLVDGLEADDLMGIMATNGRYPDAVIVSIDKDLRTIPGKHYDPVKNVADTVDPGEAHRGFLLQIVTGDKVDGYPGVPGVGPAKATKAFNARGWDADTAQSLYGPATADFLLNARMARILTSADYRRETKEIRLWTPPTMDDTWASLAALRPATIGPEPLPQSAKVEPPEP